MVQMNTKNAEQAAKLSTVSTNEAFQGNDQVQKLIQSISEISQDSKKMEEIIVVIDDIAFQTNLLALNAAVEAARAGEHGRGFAVVAEAVRTLAQRSSSSAKDINALIAESVRKVKQGSILAEQSGKVLESIVSNVKKVSELNESIATGSGEQSIAISQINQAMSQLDKSSRQNSEASQKVAEMAQDLNGRSSDMNSLIIQLGKEIGVGKAS
jgi:methyl-accepting chemotaxis protein